MRHAETRLSPQAETIPVHASTGAQAKREEIPLSHREKLRTTGVFWTPSRVIHGMVSKNLIFIVYLSAREFYDMR